MVEILVKKWLTYTGAFACGLGVAAALYYFTFRMVMSGAITPSVAGFVGIVILMPVMAGLVTFGVIFPQLSGVVRHVPYPNPYRGHDLLHQPAALADAGAKSGSAAVPCHAIYRRAHSAAAQAE